jgi:lactate permease
LPALLVRLSPVAFVSCVRQTLRQVWLAVITVMLIALAYLMNYSGLAYTLGQGAASTRHLFILFSPFLGWVAAKQLNRNPVLFAATNSSGGASWGK